MSSKPSWLTEEEYQRFLTETKEEYEIRCQKENKEQDAARRAARLADPDYKPVPIMPTVEYSETELQQGVPVVRAFTDTGLTKTRSEARRLIQQGGAYVNERRITDPTEVITGCVQIRAGKHKRARIVQGTSADTRHTMNKTEAE